MTQMTARRCSEQEIPAHKGVLRRALCLGGVEESERGDRPGDRGSQQASGSQIETGGQGAQPILVRIDLGSNDAGAQGNQVRRHEGDTGPAQEVVAPCAVTLGKADRREECSARQTGEEEAVEHRGDCGRRASAIRRMQFRP